MGYGKLEVAVACRGTCLRVVSRNTLTALVAIPGLARVFYAGLGFLLRMLQTWIEFWGPASCHVYEPALHESSKRFRAIF